MIGWILAGAAVQAASASPPAVIAAPPPAQAIDAAHLAAAQRLLDAMHVERQYDTMFTQMIPVMTMQLFGSLKDNIRVPAALRAELAKPQRQAEAQRIFAEESLRGFKTKYPEMKAATAREYAALFTAEELAQLVAFYASAIGQKTLAVLPQLQTKLMPIGMVAGRSVGETAFRHTIERLQIGPGVPKA